MKKLLCSLIFTRLSRNKSGMLVLEESTRIGSVSCRIWIVLDTSKVYLFVGMYSNIGGKLVKRGDMRGW